MHMNSGVMPCALWRMKASLILCVRASKHPRTARGKVKVNRPIRQTLHQPTACTSRLQRKSRCLRVSPSGNCHYNLDSCPQSARFLGCSLDRRLRQGSLAWKGNARVGSHGMCVEMKSLLLLFLRLDGPLNVRCLARGLSGVSIDM